MKKLFYASLLLVWTGASLASAADRSADQLVDRSPDHSMNQSVKLSRPSFSTGHPSEILHGGVVDGAAAKSDTMYLLGGPGTLTGKFETAAGEPDRQGWEGLDLTAPTEAPYWHIDTYYCANLDPSEPENHSWWCGKYFDYDCETGDFGGYGSSWSEVLDWHGTVTDPLSDVTVRLTAMMNHDVELNYDYLYLQYVDADGEAHNIQTFNGTALDVAVDASVTLTPADYVGPDSDQVQLRWFFESDGAYDDEDCLAPSLGATQIDLIEVTFDQGQGEIQIGTTETCEPGDPVQWQTVTQVGVGDFSKVWPLLNDIDLCRFNYSPQFAFIDDGEVVPGTGGYICTTWCYGPMGYIVNPEGGLAGPDYHISNRIVSPALAWPGPAYEGVMVGIDVYRHEDLAAQSPGMWANYYIRSTDDPAGVSGWSAWESWDTFGYYGGPGYYRISSDMSTWLVPDRTFVQIALGVTEWGWIWGWTGTDGTPAPYYDNVSVKAFTHGGPAIVAWDRRLAQDAFPASGSLDYADPASNSVRFDMAWNISPSSHQRNDPGDSLVADIQPLRAGSVLNDRPKLFYKLFANPEFDPYRTSGLPVQGWVYGDSARSASGYVIPDRWSFDLPDSGFFYPGDVIHYYLEAQDNLGGDIATSRLPADTLGFSVYHSPLLHPHPFVVRALPTLQSLEFEDQPRLLFWNDFAGRGSEDEWYWALAHIGYQPGDMYDVYHTSSPYSAAGNGLGGRATAAQLAGYDAIYYTCGYAMDYTITPQDFDEDVGDDVGVLDDWLRQGGKSMFLTGDNLVYDMWYNGGPQTQAFVSDWFGVEVVNIDLRPLISNQSSPTINSLAGNPVFASIDRWIAYGGCPGVNTFDAVNSSGSGQALAEFLDPAGEGGQYSYSAATLNYNATHDARVITLPYHFAAIRPAPEAAKRREKDGAGPNSMAARNAVLLDVMTYLGLDIWPGPYVDVPEQGQFTARQYPNPFNPRATIAYSLPRGGELSVKVYNLRGELVTTLLDEVRPAGADRVIWDGTDSAGSTVASGIYFYEVKALGQTKVQKMTLVR